MAKLIDDTMMLDLMADEIVAGRAQHPTGAMRNLGVTNESVERRLQKKWSADRDGLLNSATRRLPLLAESYRRGCEDGWDEAFRLVGKTYGRQVPANVLHRPNDEERAGESDEAAAQDKEAWVPLPEAARRLGLPPDTIRRRLDRGRIAGIRLRGNGRIIGRIMIKMKGNDLVPIDPPSREEETAAPAPVPELGVTAPVGFDGYIERGSDEAFRQMARPPWWSRLFMWGR